MPEVYYKVSTTKKAGLLIDADIKWQVVSIYADCKQSDPIDLERQTICVPGMKGRFVFSVLDSPMSVIDCDFN